MKIHNIINSILIAIALCLGVMNSISIATINTNLKGIVKNMGKIIEVDNKQNMLLNIIARRMTNTN